LVQTRCLNSVECFKIKNYQVEVGTTDPVAVNKPLTISARSVLQTLSKTSVRHQPKVARPFHTIHADHLGPFIKTRSGKSYILTIIDASTKFILIYAVKGTQSRHAINCLRDVIKTFGTPRRLITDQGTAFTSQAMRDVCINGNIIHHLTAVGLPRGNGQVERYHKTLLTSLATMGANTNDDQWDENIINIQLGLNGTVNATIGVTPSEALMGFRVKENPVLNNGLPDVVDVTGVREEISQRIRQNRSGTSTTEEGRHRLMTLVTW
jgi:transposase InsO family protein